MKIQADGLAGASGLTTSRTNETNGTSAGNKYRQVEGSGSGNDSIQLSGLAARISEATSAAETTRASRVSALAALYARGQYQTDSASLSKALVNHSLNQGVEGGSL